MSIQLQSHKLNFDNLALRSLPVDPEKGSRLRKVEGACFSIVTPTPLENPQTVAISTDALNLLDIDEAMQYYQDFSDYFCGNKLFDGSQTASHCYCGHQFGYFSGQLGDGCVVYLGEVINKKGQRWEMQLKGAGLTPFSRQADGRKVLRSSIREFLCSEAMHYLGIPTTRAGTCVTSDSTVIRDILYNGNPIEERATVVLRIAPTFLRFGSFEIFKMRDPETMREGPSVGRKDVLDKMLQYTIKTFYPHLWSDDDSGYENMLMEFYKEVCRRTARLVAKWQCIGWCHGVLNTDNMSIVGVTIDYGPYGFMDRFDPGYICNGSDDGGRYSYENQPTVCRWNLTKLAEAIQMSLPLSKSDGCIKEYDTEYDRSYISGMRAKFGLFKEDPEDINLVSSFLTTMFETGCDFTNGFRSLSQLHADEKGFRVGYEECLHSLVEACAPLEELLMSYTPSIPPGQLSMFMNLLQQHPELAESLQRQLNLVQKELKKQERRKYLLTLTKEQKAEDDKKLWIRWLDMYRERLIKEVSQIADLELYYKQRSELMNRSNPRVVLRNYMAQEVIEQAENGDFSGVGRLLELLKDPYGINDNKSEQELVAIEKFCHRPPASSLGLVVT